MRLLVIGGTVFVGRHFVEAALSRGHEVTIFHRGTKGTGLIPGVEEILGDRDGQMDRLAGRRWDAVVDCCGYVPRVVEQSVRALEGAVDRYLFVSTISVYDIEGQSRLDEDSPLSTLDDPTIEEVTGETYGGLKVLCEDQVTGAFGGRALIVRPGLIMGPHDPTNRFTYWVDRLASGGKAIVPARPEQPMQLIDARDLGLFMVLALEKGLSGAFNACGPESGRNFGDMIEACHRLNLGTELVWVEPSVLEEHGVQLWQDLPLALPADGSSDAMQRVDNRRAISAGLAFRSWDLTAKDTLEWRRSQPADGPQRFGIDRAREAEVLEKIQP
jgi:2'-hydroxyisoflavone reductase